MRTRNHVVRVHLNDKEMAHLNKCLSQTHWCREDFLRAAIMGTGIATKPPEDCQTIIDSLRKIGDRLNNIPVYCQSFSPEDRKQIEKARSVIWRTYDIVMESFLPPSKYYMRTLIEKGENE